MLSYSAEEDITCYLIQFYLLTRSGSGVGVKRPPTSFYPGTSTNVGFSPQNFLTFSFHRFATLV